jgi:HSP20 family protein
MTMLSEDLKRTLARVKERVDSVLDRVAPERDDYGRDESPNRAMGRPLYRGPAVDMEETEDALVVRAELPGLRPDDVNVEVTNNRLILRGEKREEREENRRGIHVVERRYGSFLRTIPLPYEIDAEHVEANAKNGVLTLRLPKTEASKGRQVQVNVRSGG